MTLHSGRQKSEAIGDLIEGEVIALPGERAAAPVIAVGSEAGVAALPEDRMIDLEGRAGRGLREQLDRAIASASAALRHQLAPQTIAANDAIGVGEEIRLGAGAAPAALQAARKPLWMTPLFIGGASSVAILAVVANVLAPGRQSGQVQISETGMPPDQQQQTLIAPSAQLAMVPKREVVAEPATKPGTTAGKPDALNEILSLKESEKPADPQVSPEASDAGSPLAQAIAPSRALVKPTEVTEKAPDADQLRGAPSVSADKKETAALSMVTELSTLVHAVREELVKLEAAQHIATVGTETKLSDFERRLSFAEARRALDTAKAIGTGSGEEAPPLTITPAAATAKPVAAAAKPARALAVKTASTPVEPEPLKRYRIQAASPGLAMLGEIDRTGEDGAPLQIAVGTQIPGWGRVKSIDQRGTTWVVQTENGAIQ
jgi:hypothetical protein